MILPIFSMINRIIKGKCIDISSEGKGVVKYHSDIVFVDGLFLGEEADILIVYQRAGVYFGKVKKLYSFSKDRIQPRCVVCSSCGGCQYQQLDYAAQLKIKTNRVKNAINRIAHIDKVSINDCIGMDDPYFYRNKIQMPFGKDKKGNIVYGFYKENSHDIIPVKKCMIEDERASSIIWDLKELLKKHRIPIYNEDSGFGILRYVLIRTSLHYDEIMVVLVTNKLNFPGQRNLINDLINIHPEITTIVENVNTRRTNVILGNKEIVLYGKGFIKDSILGLIFNISASSFYQVNPRQVEVLYKTALDLIDINKNMVVLDAYSGVGTIGLIASKKAKKVISVEISHQAHINAIENAKNNGVSNIEFFEGDAGQFISSYNRQIDMVIMDPPRKGSDNTFLNTLLNILPKQIIYISCDPETLARDLSVLSIGYQVSYIQPVDMFPFTSHVECVSLLNLKKC